MLRLLATILLSTALATASIALAQEKPAESVLPVLQVDSQTEDKKPTDKQTSAMKRKKPTLEQTIKENLNKCDLETQYIRADNGECLDKQAKQVSAKTVTPSTDWEAQCHKWASMAGISLNSYAIELIRRESKCNPTVWNHAGSGAGGIPQALPASKMGCSMTYTDAAAVCQLKWMLSYVQSRYGSWQAALAYHDIHNWY